jgi:hypothetical protein
MDNSKMINKITKQEYPDIWESIVEDHYDTTEKEHRRGSNFYTNFIYNIDEEYFPNNPELHGFWMSDTVIWDSEYGCDDVPDVLYRVEQKEVQIVTKQWVMIE